MDSDPRHWLNVLAGSHDDLTSAVSEMDAQQLRAPSYCDDWTIAQVLSHLGSGAEIFKTILDAVLAGEPPPGREVFPTIWDRWNAMTPEEQAEGFVAHDGQLVEMLENLDDRLDGLELTLFGGMHMDAVGFLGMRLSEHAIHAWDVAVALDPGAQVDPEAVQLLVDRIPMTAGRAGKAELAGDDRPLTVVVRTSDPARTFEVAVDDAVVVSELEASGATGAGGADDGLDLTAEALLRLVYGRLDPDHTPPVAAGTGGTLDRLRSVFPGM
jgi:uncharacterized protein (TIGR03083 family)